MEEQDDYKGLPWTIVIPVQRYLSRLSDLHEGAQIEPWNMHGILASHVVGFYGLRDCLGLFRQTL